MSADQRNHAMFTRAIALTAEEDGVITVPRLVPIESDYMEPTFRRGDFAAVIPCDRFSCDGLYVLDVHGYPSIYRCQSNFHGGIVVWHDRTPDSRHTLTGGKFHDILLGRVAYVCNSVYGGDLAAGSRGGAS